MTKWRGNDVTFFYFPTKNIIILTWEYNQTKQKKKLEEQCQEEDGDCHRWNLCFEEAGKDVKLGSYYFIFWVINLGMILGFIVRSGV